MVWMLPSSCARSPMAPLGAQLFVCGPMFTAEAATAPIRGAPAGSHQGHGEGAVGPDSQDARGSPQAGPRTQSRGVDGIKAILEQAGATACSTTVSTCCWSRGVRRGACAAPSARHPHRRCPDVADAVESAAATWSTAPGVTRSPTVLERMAGEGVFLDPTLGVAEAYRCTSAGKADVLNIRLCSR